MKKLFVVLLFSFFSLPSFSTTLSLYDESLKGFSHFVSAQIKKPVIVSASVTDILVTVSADYSNNDELLALYRAVIESNGLSLSFVAGVYSVVPAVAASVSSPVEPDSVFKVYYFKNSAPFDFVTALGSLSLASVSASILSGSSAVAFRGLPKEVDQAMSFAAAYDVLPVQVLIEAVIFENSTNDSHALGLSLSNALKSSGFAFGFDGGALASSDGLVLSYLSGGSFRVLVNALRQSGKFSVLSEPRLIALNHAEGYMTVGQNVPFIAGSTISDSGVVTQSIERRDVGLSIRVVPQVVGDRVQLSIVQEISSVSAAVGASDIVTNQRAIKTVVGVVSGDSVVIGGLVSSDSQTLSSGVPVLSDIPLLGKAFTSKETSIESRELSLLIKATILPVGI